MNMDGRAPSRCLWRLPFCSGNSLPRADFDVHRVWTAPLQCLILNGFVAGGGR